MNTLCTSRSHHSVASSMKLATVTDALRVDFRFSCFLSLASAAAIAAAASASAAAASSSACTRAARAALCDASAASFRGAIVLSCTASIFFANCAEAVERPLHDTIFATSSACGAKDNEREREARSEEEG